MIISNDMNKDSSIPNFCGVGTGGTAIINLITQSILYNNSNASSNFVVNIRGDGSTTLNSLLSNGESITC